MREGLAHLIANWRPASRPWRGRPVMGRHLKSVLWILWFYEGHPITGPAIAAYSLVPMSICTVVVAILQREGLVTRERRRGDPAFRYRIKSEVLRANVNGAGPPPPLSTKAFPDGPCRILSDYIKAHKDCPVSDAIDHTMAKMSTKVEIAHKRRLVWATLTRLMKLSRVTRNADRLRWVG